MFLWFHFASRSFHGCHYKLCFLLEQRYWKILHYIHLWIIVQSVWCQSPFQSPSGASPSCLACSFSLPLMAPSLYFCCYYLNPAYLNNSLTSLAVHMEENIPFYSRLNGGINQSDKRKGKGFMACASSGKGNLQANNCVSILTSSPETLFLVWAGCGLVGSMSMSRKGKALSELWLNFDFIRERKEEEEGSFT